MAYILPAAIKCLKCDYKWQGQLITNCAVYRPKCFHDFIRQHVPLPDPDRKPFAPNSFTFNL
ncbi:hypothetical protein CCL08_19785 [Pseudomonas congelans]|nr:hypothetical protein CCL08_19785 [Pseudomonas congelans]